MPYTKTEWHDFIEGGVLVNAARLNNLETQYEEAIADIQATASDPSTPIGSAIQAAADEAAAEVVTEVSPQEDWTGAVSLGMADSRSAYLVRRLTGNVTLTVEDGEAGVAYSCTLELQQDGTGGRTIVLANVRTAYGVAIALSPGANAVDLVHLLWNGSAWSAMLGAAQMSIPSGWVV